jgi:hypothetical protein
MAVLAAQAALGVVDRAGQSGSEGKGRLDASAGPSGRTWSVDYRVRSMFESSTSYQFGTPWDDPDGPYAPLSKLDFALNSTWHGLQLGLERPNWRVRFEWLTPMEREIGGVLADFDWNIDDPRDDPSRLDLLTHSSLRWNDGQMLDLGASFKLTDLRFRRPIEVWPAAGFRFQRFDVTGSSLSYLVPPLGPVPDLEGVDVITFNQQYYVGYFGGELRTTVFAGRAALDVRFQGDAGPTAGYNIDHHLLRPGKRLTMERTSGAAWHIAIAVEAPLTKRLAVGLQAEHMEIRTSGTHRLLNAPADIDLTWDNGVLVQSNQTSLTAYLRARF